MNQIIAKRILRAPVQVKPTKQSNILKWHPVMGRIEEEWAQCGPIFRCINIVGIEEYFVVPSAIQDIRIADLTYTPSGIRVMPMGPNLPIALQAVGIEAKDLLDSRRIFV